MYIRYGHVAVAVGLLIIDLVFIYEYEGVIKDDTDGECDTVIEEESNVETESDGDIDNSCRFLFCRFIFFTLRS